MLTTLYKQDKKGKMRFWQIEVIDDELVTRFGTTDGEVQEHIEYVSGNSLRDEEEQALSKADSQIKRRVNNGFRHTEEEAIAYDGSNELGFHKPMLAARWDKIKDIDYNNSTYQHKFDGHRCLITNNAGEKIAYSRGGKVIKSIDHILETMDIPEGYTLDGELYVHGEKLQTIGSYVRRVQEKSKLLNFHCYDMIAKENFEDRMKELLMLRLGDNAHIVESLIYDGSITDMLGDALNRGYEGLIIRPNTGFVYEDGRRSKGLIKMKPLLDSEFLVADINPSKDGWAVLTCVTEDGKTFNASAPGSVPEKFQAMKNKATIVGRYVRVEFVLWTIDGLPSQPIATGYRQLGE